MKSRSSSNAVLGVCERITGLLRLIFIINRSTTAATKLMVMVEMDLTSDREQTKLGGTGYDFLIILITLDAIKHLL